MNRKHFFVDWLEVHGVLRWICIIYCAKWKRLFIQPLVQSTTNVIRLSPIESIQRFRVYNINDIAHKKKGSCKLPLQIWAGDGTRMLTLAVLPWQLPMVIRHGSILTYASGVTSGPATPSGYFKINSINFFLDRFFNFFSRITASDRDGFSMLQINLQGTPLLVASSCFILCLCNLSRMSFVCPL